MGLNRDLGNIPEVIKISGSNVGIGTPTAAEKLDVNGTSIFRGIATFGGNINVVDSNTLNLGYNQGGGATLKYNSNGNLDITPRSGYSTVFASGNVGVGTPSPAGKLSIVDTYYNTFFSDTSSQYGSGLILSGDAGSDQRSWKQFAKNGNGGVSLTFEVSTSGVSYGANPTGLTYSEKMRITSGGNVGIGTTSPTTESGYTVLSLNNSTYGGLITMKYAGTDVAKFYGDSSGARIESVGATNTRFYNNGSERMRITSGGNVLIGTSSDNGYKLNVNGSISATSLSLSGNYSVDVTTNSSWSSYQTIISPGNLSAGVTYMISIRWNFTYPSNNQPYYCYCSFLWQGASTNGTGTDNEFTPICSTHTGGTGANISFRSIAGMAATSGIQARLNSFPTLGGVMTVKATRLE